MSTETRKPIISGNWKMNQNHFEAIQCVQKLAYLVGKDDFASVDVSVHPPFTDIRSVQTLIDADLTHKEPVTSLNFVFTEVPQERLLFKQIPNNI